MTRVTVIIGGAEIDLILERDGKIYPIETVWYIEVGTKNPSFISAYPV